MHTADVVPDLGRLLSVREIFAEPAAPASARGREVLARLPDVAVTGMLSHWRIPEPHGNEGSVDRWVRVETETPVLGVEKSLTARPNGRSSNWIARSTADGWRRPARRASRPGHVHPSD